MTLTYEELIEKEPRLKREKPRFDRGFLLCGNCCSGAPASASMSVAVGWIGCAPCVTGEADSFDDEDLVLEETSMLGKFTLKVTPPAEFDLTLDQGAKWAVLAVKELEGEKCFCGAEKVSMQTFCRPCYKVLPPGKQKALYRRIFDGYEEAYKDAREYLFKKGTGEVRSKGR